MDSRRTWMIGVAGVVGLALAGRFAVTTFVTEPLAVLQKAEKAAKDKAAKTQRRVVAARMARVDLTEAEALCLPGNPSLAQEAYQRYLIELLQGAQVAHPTITPGSPSFREGVYLLPFAVQGECSQPALVQMLHQFYLAPRLHQIGRLTLNPIERPDKGPAIKFSLAIEALARGEAEGPRSAPPEYQPAVKPAAEAYAALARRPFLLTRGGGNMAWGANDPEHVILSSIIHDGRRFEATLYDRATGQSRKVATGDAYAVGTSSGKVLDIGIRDVVVEADGGWWRWPLGARFRERSPLPPEKALAREIERSGRSRRFDGR